MRLGTRLGSEVGLRTNDPEDCTASTSKVEQWNSYQCYHDIELLRTSVTTCMYVCLCMCVFVYVAICDCTYREQNLHDIMSSSLLTTRHSSIDHT